MQNELKGVWTLLEAVSVDGTGQETGYPLGKTPAGVVQIGADRLTGVVCGDPWPAEDQRPFLAYSGPYQFDGRMLTTTTDSASSLDMLVSQQREIVFVSPTRMIVQPLNAVLGSSAGDVMKLTWERVG